MVQCASWWYIFFGIEYPSTLSDCKQRNCIHVLFFGYNHWTGNNFHLQNGVGPFFIRNKKVFYIQTMVWLKELKMCTICIICRHICTFILLAWNRHSTLQQKIDAICWLELFSSYGILRVFLNGKKENCNRFASINLQPKVLQPLHFCILDYRRLNRIWTAFQHCFVHAYRLTIHINKILNAPPFFVFAPFRFCSCDFFILSSLRMHFFTMNAVSVLFFAYLCSVTYSGIHAHLQYTQWHNAMCS